MLFIVIQTKPIPGTGLSLSVSVVKHQALSSSGYKGHSIVQVLSLNWAGQGLLAQLPTSYLIVLCTELLAVLGQGGLFQGFLVDFY